MPDQPNSPLQAALRTAAGGLVPNKQMALVCRFVRTSLGRLIRPSLSSSICQTTDPSVLQSVYLCLSTPKYHPNVEWEWPPEAGLHASKNGCALNLKCSWSSCSSSVPGQVTVDIHLQSGKMEHQTATGIHSQLQAFVLRSDCSGHGQDSDEDSFYQHEIGMIFENE